MSQQEDTVHADISPRIGLEPSRKKFQEELFDIRQNRERGELNDVLATESGQAVIMRILDKCHIYSESHLSEAAQGQRCLGIYLIKEIRSLSIESYPAMLQNHDKRQKRIKEEEAAMDSNAKGK